MKRLLSIFLLLLMLNHTSICFAETETGDAASVVRLFQALCVLETGMTWTECDAALEKAQLTPDKFYYNDEVVIWMTHDEQIAKNVQVSLYYGDCYGICLVFCLPEKELQKYELPESSAPDFDPWTEEFVNEVFSTMQLYKNCFLFVEIHNKEQDSSYYERICIDLDAFYENKMHDIFYLYNNNLMPETLVLGEDGKYFV